MVRSKRIFIFLKLLIWSIKYFNLNSKFSIETLGFRILGSRITLYLFVEELKSVQNQLFKALQRLYSKKGNVFKANKKTVVPICENLSKSTIGHRMSSQFHHSVFAVSFVQFLLSYADFQLSAFSSWFSLPTFYRCP